MRSPWVLTRVKRNAHLYSVLSRSHLNCQKCLWCITSTVPRAQCACNSVWVFFSPHSSLAHFSDAFIFIGSIPSIYPSVSFPGAMMRSAWLESVRQAPLDLDTGASSKQTEKSGIQKPRHSFISLPPTSGRFNALRLHLQYLYASSIHYLWRSTCLSKKKRIQADVYE